MLAIRTVIKRSLSLIYGTKLESVEGDLGVVAFGATLFDRLAVQTGGLFHSLLLGVRFGPHRLDGVLREGVLDERMRPREVRMCRCSCRRI